jgi:gliding motility-associated-like protein
VKKGFQILLCCFFGSFISGQSPLAVTLEKVDETCFKGNASISISGGTAPFQITWSTGESDKASVNNLSTGYYSVMIKDAGNEDTLISFTIEDLNCDVGISNHFTPNDDGFNDTWGITNTWHYPNFELYVFNRSGQTVHHQSGQYFPWDGKSFGIKVPDATYYYVFYFDRDSKDKLLKGDVSILR